MVTIIYREPGDFMSEEKPGEVKKFITEARDAQPHIEDGWVMVRTRGGRLLFAVQSHKVLEVKGDA